MINRIKALFADSAGPTAVPHSRDELALAAAALLVEAARMDENFDEAEREAVAEALRGQFSLSDEECDTLIRDAEAAQHEATDLFRFTRKINDSYDHGERLRLIELIWQVVYADGALHAYEANLVRRMGGLLHVSDQELGEARHDLLHIPLIRITDQPGLLGCPGLERLEFRWYI